MSVAQFIERVRRQPQTIGFDETMAVIAANYDYAPAGFSNGELVNAAGQNEGSCKLFAFAELNGLSEDETLACFGDYYRVDVLQNPTGTDHGNIRNFMVHGWAGIAFDAMPLTPRTPD